MAVTLVDVWKKTFTFEEHLSNVNMIHYIHPDRTTGFHYVNSHLYTEIVLADVVLNTVMFKQLIACDWELAFCHTLAS